MIRPSEWSSILQKISQDEPVKLFKTATTTVEIVRQLQMKYKVDVRANSGVTIRWPGLIKSTKKPSAHGMKPAVEHDYELFAASL